MTQTGIGVRTKDQGPRTKDQGPRTKDQGSRWPSDARGLTARALAAAVALAGTAPAFGKSGGDAGPFSTASGISHYELVVLGTGEFSEDTIYNMAYEVTDSGIVVGQIRRQVELSGGETTLVYQGFFYLDRALFGKPVGHFEFLPSLLPGGEPSLITPSIALDVNADGWIVGGMGQDAFLFPAVTNSRAAAWRLSDAQTPFARTIAPPQPSDGETGGERVFGWLGAVSEGEEPWAAFTFEGPLCGLGNPVVLRSDLAASVRLDLDAGTSEPLFRTLCLACPENDVTDLSNPGARLAAHGISPDGSRLCGSRETCADQQTCLQPTALRARQWFRDEECPPNDCGVAFFHCPPCLTPNEVPEPADSSFFAKQRSVLDDGTAVGFVADLWPEVASNSCKTWAYAWNPLDACEAHPCLDDGSAPLYIGTRLPIPELMLPQLVRSEAFDVERNLATANGRRAGHFAVGDVATKIPGKPDPALRGLVWFAEGDQVSNWAVADINQMVSPTSPISGVESFTVRALRGVNTRGDAVGMAEFMQIGATDPIRRAVLLRAVPLGLRGDLNRDGTVNASDLTLLLGFWCTEATASCVAIADLNLDGLVNGTDLTILIGNWGNGQATAAATHSGEPVPEAVALETKDAVEFSIEFVGLGGIEGYKEWAATAPAPLRELVEQVVWNTAKGGVE